MMTVQEMAGQLVKCLEAAGFERKALAELMTEGATVVGMGAEQLDSLLRKRQGSFVVQPLGAEYYLVFGRLKDSLDGADDEKWGQPFTAVCQKQGETLKIRHLQVTPECAYLQCQDGRQIPKQVRELAALGRYIAGGAHCCRQDKDLTILFCSESFLTLTGYSREEIAERFQHHFRNMIYAEDLPELDKQLRVQRGQEVIDVEYRIRRKDGTLIWVLDKKRPVVLEGEALYFCILLDTTAQNQQKEELRLSLERHQVIMDQVVDVIFEWDMRQDTLLLSDNWEKKFGYEPITTDVSQRLPYSENVHPQDVAVIRQLIQDTAAGVPYSESEVRLRDSQHHYWWNRIRVTTQYRADGQPIKAIGVISNIDEEKRQRQQLIEQAQHDPLTRVLNKRIVQSLVEEGLNHGRFQQGALLLLDLDGFKQINDTWGHLYGDVLLADVADVLRQIMPEGGLLGRIGGDEFLIFVPDLFRDGAARLAETIQSALKERINDAERCVSLSIGGAFYPQDGQDFVTLYRLADQALYAVKKNGKCGYQAYQAQMAEEAGKIARLVVDSVIDSDAMIVDLQLSQYCFRMLYEAIDLKTAVNSILEIVGRSYQVSRVYIFENSMDNLQCSNTFEWCAEGIEPEIDNLQGLRYDVELAGFLDCLDERGLLCYSDVSKLPGHLYEVLKPQGVRSILQCGIWDGGVFRGYVGFDECRHRRVWKKEEVNSLVLIANVLSTFLLKERYKERLKELERY